MDIVCIEILREISLNFSLFWKLPHSSLYINYYYFPKFFCRKLIFSQIFSILFPISNNSCYVYLFEKVPQTLGFAQFVQFVSKSRNRTHQLLWTQNRNKSYINYWIIELFDAWEIVKAE